MAEVEKRRIEDHAKIVVGTGLSISFTEFMSEYIARVAGVTEWKKFFTKAVVKTAIGGGFLYLAGKVREAGLAFILQLAGYAPMGTIVWDFINTLYPGGLWGMAEAAALKTRGGGPTPAKETRQMAQPITTTTRAQILKLAKKAPAQVKKAPAQPKEATAVAAI